MFFSKLKRNIISLGALADFILTAGIICLNYISLKDEDDHLIMTRWLSIVHTLYTAVQIMKNYRRADIAKEDKLSLALTTGSFCAGSAGFLVAVWMVEDPYINFGFGAGNSLCNFFPKWLTDAYHYDPSEITFHYLDIAQRFVDQFRLGKSASEIEDDISELQVIIMGMSNITNEQRETQEHYFRNTDRLRASVRRAQDRTALNTIQNDLLAILKKVEPSIDYKMLGKGYPNNAIEMAPLPSSSNTLWASNASSASAFNPLRIEQLLLPSSQSSEDALYDIMEENREVRLSPGLSPL